MKIDTLWQDLRYATRSLRRTPSFTIAAIVTLGLGIGANTAIFTLLDAVMFKPLNVPSPQDLVTLYERPRQGDPDATGGTGRYMRFSYPRIERLRAALGSRGSLAAMTRTGTFVVRLPGQQQPESVRGQLVSGEYFSTLEVPVVRGRTINREDVTLPDGQPVAVIGDRLWKERLGSADVLGKTITVSGVTATIVGIAPPGFIGAWSDARADLWLPLTMQQTLGYRSNMSSYGDAELTNPWVTQDVIAWLNVIGRIPAGEQTQARASFQVANRAGVEDLANAVHDPQFREEVRGNALVMESLTQGFSRLRAQLSEAFIALTAMVAIVLLVACANVANLLLARSAARARELAIRIAVGATRARLVQQGLVESVLLATIGGAAGWVFGQWSSSVLASAFLATSRDQLPEVYSPDVRVLIFTAAVSIATALLCGLLPAARTARSDSQGALVVTSRSTGGPSIMRGMRPLVAAQLALAVVVVFAAALLGRSLVNFAKVDPGYDTDHLVSVSFSPSASGYSAAQIPALSTRLVDAVKTTPGFVSAAVATCGLLDNCQYSSSYFIDGDRARDQVELDENYIGPGYFTTAGIPIAAGREFDDRDRDGGALVAIVSESVAKRYYPGLDPIGRRIGDREFTAEIVGVVGDVRPRELREAPIPMLYLPMRQWPNRPNNLAIRVSGDPSTAIASVRTALQRAEPGLVLDNVGTMALQIDRNILRERLVTYLAAAFGALALLLGCIGLYGVLSYSVARRTQEFGVRLALGARPFDLTRDVLGDASRVALAGTAIGLLAALWVSGLLEALLFQVSTFDPVVAVASAALLLVATLAASYLPARRAARVNPIAALKTD
ncbi:MAG TPA: ABC transporter permease [Vicinamibacterales bacterium]|nr:ABC transporter permease [Vicinamibacterales bacterium]